MLIFDIHTHHPAPRPEAIVCVDPAQLADAVAGQLYSVGIHPWKLEETAESDWAALSAAARRKEVVAIGETGIDLTRSLPLYKQIQAFKRHIDLSESVGKPLVIHDVKAHDIIVGLRKELRPKQEWVIHGFRGKPTVAEMLIKAGCMLSFGDKFNAETVVKVPANRILAETDESPLPINEIIASLSSARGYDIKAQIAINAATLLQIQIG